MNSMIKRTAQRGTTLVETLVALVVLSVGLLGIAALQMASLTNNRGAHLRSQAAVLAYDIADRMRANRVVAMANGYAVTYAGTITGTTLNAVDVQAWKANLARTLPSGTGQIVAVGNMQRISVQWTDSLGTQTFVTRTQL